MDLILTVMGGIALLIGYVWLLVACFSESIMWGIVALLISPLALVFGILNWDELKAPTILYAAGGVVLSDRPGHLVGQHTGGVVSGDY